MIGEGRTTALGETRFERAAHLARGPRPLTRKFKTSGSQCLEEARADTLIDDLGGGRADDLEVCCANPGS
jgi:hypothetical protein